MKSFEITVVATLMVCLALGEAIFVSGMDYRSLCLSLVTGLAIKFVADAIDDYQEDE